MHKRCEQRQCQLQRAWLLLTDVVHDGGGAPDALWWTAGEVVTGMMVVVVVLNKRATALEHCAYTHLWLHTQLGK